MDLHCESLDDLEVPLPNEYWTGFFAAAALGTTIVLAVAIT